MTDLTSTSQTVDRDELLEAATEVLDGMFEASLAGTPPLPADGRQEQVIESSVRILGEEPGLLTMHTPGAVAWGLAAALVGERADDLDVEDVVGVIAELTNLMGGVTKSVFVGETHLDVPVAAAVPAESVAPSPDSITVFHPMGQFTVHLVGLPGGHDSQGGEAGA